MLLPDIISDQNKKGQDQKDKGQRQGVNMTANTAQGLIRQSNYRSKNVSYDQT